MKWFVIICIALLVLVVFPYVHWQLLEPIHLEVAIIDKTVPDESFREHLGITWLLNHMKYVKRDGASYDLATDYYGFVPDDHQQTYSIRPLPDSYNDVDLIYVADTYGVYEEDFS